ncbi:MAG: cell division/cell wall cluster transcriptional repressor MraZ [Candidatus Aquicultor secundus]|uniref:Transcriptional regulator MraZ n=1 Tax=Candidatus Aquicultor secundus TaxID=1973895 RepID=A0A2M7TBD0_9ACTN|nr:division/cell wall cluster transcriptional repressor MraZ [Candidatus Aquicultor secundus]NCO66800.1 division/cell wall cluster transcriptional repressor MraZ [Solirubrobacter sp.]OIO85523.1 MAG: division/cell wall cluster transcriptional repressor MraZ [Candidatus Aquicultor secundus]PIU26128.1 MAG: cell division/cell wall cluster transcriptional repressor MraZ [Candidatus Aquicultor secundus]PIW22673.1 MAG: cell division/cell wall cluster transcriptional repressor MraZ [Candidatus Aquicult
MFFGEYYHSLDEKGRVILPVKFRDALADGLFITKSFDSCLLVYTRKDWFERVDEIMSKKPATAEVRNYQRFVIGSAVEDEVSRQGRISIPQNLRDFAGLDRDIVIIGVANKLEIWAKERYERFIADAEKSASEIGEEIADIGV